MFHSFKIVHNDIVFVVREALTSASTLLCGDSSAFKVEDEYGIANNVEGVNLDNYTRDISVNPDVWTDEQFKEMHLMPS